MQITNHTERSEVSFSNNMVFIVNEEATTEIIGGYPHKKYWILADIRQKESNDYL